MTPLDYFFYPFFFILGITLGSFYNVVALRVPQKKSLISPPSHCPSCERKLDAIDLLPLFGYLIRKGKCASCGVYISKLYPFGELVTGLIFVLAYAMHGDNYVELLLSLLLISLCMIVTITDLVYTIIPNVVLLFFLPLFLGLRLLSHPEPWSVYVIGCALGFLILYLPAVIKPGAMGMGDVKLLALFGLILGWKAIIITVFFSSLLGLLGGLLLMALGKAKWKQGIPFGPYLCVGAIISYFWSNEIWLWYFSQF